MSNLRYLLFLILIGLVISAGKKSILDISEKSENSNGSGIENHSEVSFENHELVQGKSKKNQVVIPKEKLKSVINKTTLKKKHANPAASDSLTTADKVIESIIYVILALSGIYICLSGFKAFRLTMVILGFFVSYYGLLFLVTELGVYKGDNVGHELGLFFGSFIIGFIISVACYMLDRINFMIFGAAVSSMICLFLLQFFFDMKISADALILAIVFFSGSLLFAVIAFFVLDHFIIFGTAFIGAIITPINIGIMMGNLEPFENRKKLDSETFKNALNYFVACGFMLLTGLCSQYYLRRRIIKRWENEIEEENSRGTFLDDKF